MSNRNENSFWAVWHDGMEYPSLYASREIAEARVRQHAKERHGKVIHLMSLDSVATAKYPEDSLVTTGCM